jgi:hypothetical protein
MKKIIPKIEFRYSEVYDRNYRESIEIKNILKEKNQEYPSKEEIFAYMKKVKKLWAGQEEKILSEISKVSKFDWKEKRIICYVIGIGRPFSEPLTMRTYGKNTNRFITTLIHELIHQIFTQNKKEYSKWHNFVLEKYEKEERLTKTHILLSAIHWKILDKFFGKDSIEKEIKQFNHEEYKRAWEIVKKETPDKIIKKFYEIIENEKNN